MSYIYLVTNKLNGKQYVGQHKYDGVGLDQKYFGSGVLLWKAYEKYGMENFDMELVEECLEEDLNPLEQLYIEYYNTLKPNGYNLTEGGEGVSGFKFSPETIKKLSLSHKGKKPSLETIEKMRQNRIGYVTPESTKEKISNSLMGHYVSDETKRKQSESHIGQLAWNKGIETPIEVKRKISDAHINNPLLSKKVNQYKKDGTLVKTHASTAEAARTLNSRPSHIIECCNGKRKTAYGFIWKYADDETKKAA